MDEKIPQLTLTPDLNTAPAPEVRSETDLAAKQPAPEAGPELSALSEAEQNAVHAFAKEIDLSNSTQILQYGVAAQKNITDFSESALESVRTKDMGEIGDMITGLMMELRGFDGEEEEKKGILGLFRKASRGIEAMKAKYEKAEVNVDKISEQLEKHQITLMKDIAILDQMYQKNLEYYKQLTMYILAGKEKLAQERSTTLVSLQEKAKASGSPEDAQAANDYANLCQRFEKKLHDLELTRVISVQMAPQIRMIQNNNTIMTEKIQTTIINTIPLWKSQMVLALGLAHSQQAIEAQRAVTDMTNELLKKNAATLKQGTIAAAKESERGIVDIETLQQTNRSLIETLDEVVKIQNEGREKRAAAETELGRIEGELKAKLLEIAR